MWKPAERDHCPAHVRATEYVRAELRNEELRRFEAHLESCASCRDAVTDLRETLSLVEESAPPAFEGPDVTDRVLARIGDREWSAPFRDRRIASSRALVVSLAAVFVVTALVLWVVDGRFSTTDVPAPVTKVARTISTIERSPIEASLNGPESALGHARDWLVSVQEPDGSWEPRRWGGAAEYQIALTGLATLALSGDDRPAVRDAAARAGRFLVNSQSSDGHFGERTRSSLYNHALGTLALTELASSRETLRESARRAARYLVRMQTDEGAWGYVSGERTIANDSISVWALQALVRARALDLAVDRQAIEMGFDWFEGLVRREAPRTYLGFGGHVCGEASSPLVAFAVLSRGASADARTVHVALDRLVREPEAAALCFYDSYFVARSSLVDDHPVLEEFRVRTRRALQGTQIKTGQLSGSWEPRDQWSAVGGRIYTTALAALALKPADVRGRG